MGNRLCGRAVNSLDASIKAEVDAELAKPKSNDSKEKIVLVGTFSAGKSTFSNNLKAKYLPDSFGKEPYHLHMSRTTLKRFLEAVIQKVPNSNEKWLKLSQDCRLWTDVVRDVYYYEGYETDSLFWKEFVETFSDLEEEMCVDAKNVWNALVGKDRMLKMLEKEFRPETLDILQARVITTGIHELEFDFEDFHVNVVDVGAPRSERKKWIHCFFDVSFLFFVVDVSTLWDPAEWGQEDDGHSLILHNVAELLGNMMSNKWWIDKVTPNPSPKFGFD